MTRKLIALFALLMLSVACARVADSRDGGDAGSKPEDPVTSSPVDPNEPIPSPSPRIVEPRDGLLNVHPRIFDEAVLVDEDTVRLEFYMGIQECYGIDRVDVEYGEEVVVLTIHEGNVPPGDQVCIDLAEFVAVIVELDEPVSGREIVDGAADEGEK